MPTRNLRAREVPQLPSDLNAVFASVGLMESTQPISKLAKMMPWVTHYKPGTLRFVGLM